MFGLYKNTLANAHHNIRLFLLGQALQSFGYSIYALLLNLLLKEMGHDTGIMGYLAATTSLGTALIAFPAAFVLERFHVKPLVCLGVALMGSAYLAQLNTTSLEWITILGLIGAMGLAIFNISVSPFFYRNTRREERVCLFGLNSSVVMMSHMLGYLLGGLLPAIFGLKYSMMIGLGFSLSSLLVFSRISLRPVPAPTRSLTIDPRSRSWRLLMKLIIPKVALALGAGLIIPFLNIYLKTRFSMNTQTIGHTFALLQLFTFMGVFFSPMLVKRMAPLSFMMLTSVFSIPFMLVMALSGSVTIVLGSLFMRGMLMNMSGPVTSLFEMERVKESDCLFASAMLAFCYNAAWTVSTQVGGMIIERYSFQHAFVLAASFYTCAVIFYWLFFRSEKEQEAAATPELAMIEGEAA